MSTAELIHVDPATLLIDKNIREVVIDAVFRKSIKTNGVIVPLVAVRSEDGPRVRDGHRRTVAAIEVGLENVPVYLTDDSADAERIITQIAANDHRTDLTTAERVAAFHQLSVIGYSPAKIVKHTHARRKDVDAALAIADKPEAIKVADVHTLAVAAWLVEFENDATATERILREAKWRGENGARHVVEDLRTERADAAAYAEAVASITDVTVIDEPDYSDTSTTRLDLLRTTNGKRIDPAAHRDCPGHAIVVTEAYVVGEGEVDDDGEPLNADDSDPVDLHAAGRSWTFTPYCVNYAEHGHVHQWAARRSAGSPTSDASDAEAVKQAAAVERKRVLAGNKAWTAATTVRGEWVAKMLARRTPPEGAVLFCLRAVAGSIDLGPGRDALRAKVDAPDSYGPVTVPDLTPPAATMALLTYVVTALEGGSSRDDWRRSKTSTALYLTQLAAWGYALAEVEVAASGGEAFTLPAAS